MLSKHQKNISQSKLNIVAKLRTRSHHRATTKSQFRTLIAQDLEFVDSQRSCHCTQRGPSTSVASIRAQACQICLQRPRISRHIAHSDRAALETQLTVADWPGQSADAEASRAESH